jgi:hypothetical protein
MGIWDSLNKMVKTINSVGQELQTCIYVVESANLSNVELKKCAKGTSDIYSLFRGTEAENIDSTFKRMAVKKVAIDRGIISQ